MTQIKKYVTWILGFVICLSLAACGNTNATSETPGDTPVAAEAFTAPIPDILTELTQKAGETLSGEDRIPVSLNIQLDADNVQGNLGLTADQFAQYIDEAYVSKAMIGSQPHEIVLARCHDAQAAITVKSLVAQGFDSGQWVCVSPDQSVAVESERYVLLAVSREAAVKALLDAFTQLSAAAVGTPNVFYTKN